MRRDALYFSMTLCLAIICIITLLSKYYFLAPAIPVLVIALLWLYKSPEHGLLALIFFVPLEGLFAGNGLFTAPKMIGIALLVIVSIRLLCKQAPISNLRTPLWYPILFLVLAFGIGTVLSPYPGTSLQSFKQLLTAVSIFYITLSIKDRLNPVYLARVIVISVGATALIALIESDQAKEGRAIGLLTDPNYFALLLTFAIPLAVYLAIYEKMLVARLLFFILLGTFLVAFEKTFSRSGLVVLVLVVGVLGWHYKKYFRNFNVVQMLLVFFSVCVLGVMLTFLAPQEYRDRILSLANLSSGVHAFEDRSLGRRSSYIVIAFEEFKENPILGSGPGMFPLRYAQSGYAAAFSLNKNEPELFRRAHNTYLEVLAETGIVGLFSLCGIVWIATRQFRLGRLAQLRRGNTQQAAFAAHYLAAFSAIILFFLFLTGINNKYFWVFLALSELFFLSKNDSLAKGSDMERVLS